MAPAPTSASNDGLTEVVKGLNTLMENEFKGMSKKMKDISNKYEEQDKRLKLMETTIKSMQSSTRTDGAYGSKENDVR